MPIQPTDSDKGRRVWWRQYDGEMVRGGILTGFFEDRQKAFVSFGIGEKSDGVVDCQSLTWADDDARPEKINHPSHYGGDTVYEAIKVIEAWRLGFNLGNTVKYIARAEHKGATLEDLKKAAWYLAREISNREKSDEANTCT